MSVLGKLKITLGQSSLLTRNMMLSLFTGAMTFVNGTVIFVVIGRTLTVDEFGIVALAMTIAATVALVPGYGFDVYVVREIAQRRTADKGRLVAQILTAKILLSMLAICIIAWYVSTSAAVTSATAYWLIGIAGILATFTSFLNAVQKADESFVPEAAANAIQSLSLLGLLLFSAWLFGLSVFWVSLIVLVSRVLALGVASLSYASSRHGRAFADPASTLGENQHTNTDLASARRFDTDEGSYGLASVGTASGTRGTRRTEMRHLVSGFRSCWDPICHATAHAFPFALQTMLGMLYFQVDTLIMAEILPPSQMAYYQASMRLILAAMLLPSILISVFYPRVARELASGRNSKKTLLNSRLLLETLLVIGGLLTAIFYIGAPLIIEVLYGPRMLPAVTILQVLSLILIVRFVAGGLGLVLIAGHKQYVQILGATVAIFLSIGLNVLLLPRLGITSAAWINVFTNCVVLLVYLLYVLRFFGSWVVRPNYSLLLITLNNKTLRPFTVER